MAKDYYGILGVSRDATDDEIKRAYRKLARAVPPGRQPGPGGAGEVQGDQRRVRGALRPEKRQIVDLGGDPLAPGRRRRSGRPGGAGPFVGFQDIMDAFFGGAAAAPAARARAPGPGADAILRLELDLHETAFGVEAPITVDTAVLCTTCSGAGTAPGTHPATCETCGGRGEVQSVQRTFLGQVVSARPCPACQGYGTVIPHPCADLRRRRPGPHPPHADREDPGRRRGRHAHPAGPAGRGRPRRRPGRRPLRRDPRAAARRLLPQGRRPALPGHACR